MNIKNLKLDNKKEIPVGKEKKVEELQSIDAKETAIKEVKFWTEIDGKVTIKHAELIDFLSANGFAKVIFDEKVVCVREYNKMVTEVSDNRIISFIQSYLHRKKWKNVYEKFVTGIANYTTQKKQYLLKEISMVSDRDDFYSSRIFFKNCFCEVFKDNIKVRGYDELNNNIWKSRIINRDYETPQDSEKGQFEKFAFNISKKDNLRFEGLKSIIGYLLHRNKERGEPAAIILYDENMTNSHEANGRTGKTLLSKAINEIREVVTFDGKDLKKGNWFKNQRMTIRTDIMNYDDLLKTFSLEECYPLLTTGVTIEKKRKDSIFIPFEYSPKLMLSSNYYVSGPTGPSDRARRHEFEIANHYNERFTPEDEFGNRFFGKDWDNQEWNKFYNFMMQCISCYLKNGLIEVPAINLGEEKTIRYTHPDFYEFIVDKLTLNIRMDKRQLLEEFKSQYHSQKDLSSHIFTKWLKEYALIIGGNYTDRSSGGNYYFKISKSISDEEE